MKSIILLISTAMLLTACQPTTAPNSETKSVTSSDQSSLTKTKTVSSSASFAETETKLRAALDTRGLKLFTVVDHGAGAKSVGEDIGGSKLFIFGNPKAGTPLMQAEPNLGLVLPMKILLRESGGEVTLSRTDITAAVKAYGVTGQDGRLGKISGALDGIMAEAAGG